MNDYLLYFLLFSLLIGMIYVISFTISWWKGSRQKDDIDELDAAQEWLMSLGLTISSAAGEIAIDPERCVDCGICSSVCPSGALSCSTPDWRLQFDQRRCVVCEQCIAVCPLDAISLKL